MDASLAPTPIPTPTPVPTATPAPAPAALTPAPPAVAPALLAPATVSRPSRSRYTYRKGRLTRLAVSGIPAGQKLVVTVKCPK